MHIRHDSVHHFNQKRQVNASGFKQIPWTVSGDKYNKILSVLDALKPQSNIYHNYLENENKTRGIVMPKLQSGSDTSPEPVEENTV